MNDEEFVKAFNNTVKISAFGIPRSGYLSALREQFKIREIDFSNIGNETSMSFYDKIILLSKNGKKSVQIIDKPKLKKTNQTNDGWPY